MSAFASLASAIAAAQAANHLKRHPWLEYAARAKEKGDVELEQLCLACHDVVVLVEALIARTTKGGDHEDSAGP